MNGRPLHSSFSSPEKGSAKTRLDITLQTSHDYSDLVCRLSTVAKLPSVASHFYYENMRPKVYPPQPSSSYPKHAEEGSIADAAPETSTIDASATGSSVERSDARPDDVRVHVANENSPAAGKLETTITDVSILIQMYCE